MLRGHEYDPIYSLSIYTRFSGRFFLKFSLKKIVMGKKIVFRCNDDRLFLRNNSEVLFLPAKRA